MKKNKPIPPNEKKLRRKLTEMTEQVRGFLGMLDTLMLQPSSRERGQKIAELCNRLALYNDGIRYFWCGVDYRKDTPWKGDLASLESAPSVGAVDPQGGRTPARPRA